MTLPNWFLGSLTALLHNVLDKNLAVNRCAVFDYCAMAKSCFYLSDALGCLVGYLVQIVS